MELREAWLSDDRLLYRWRLDDEKTAEWWRGEHPGFPDHYNWLDTRLMSPDLCRIYVAELNGEPIGQARVESSGEISFSIAQEHRRLGYGRELVERASEAAVRDLERPYLKAVVDGANEAGLKTLLAAGYELCPDVRYLRWHP